MKVNLSDVRTFPKYKGEAGISHLIAEAYPRVTFQTKFWEEQRRLKDPSEQEDD